MQGPVAKRLIQNKEKILSLWAERAAKKFGSARNVDAVTLANSVPRFLDHLVEALAKNRKLDVASLALHDAESMRLGKIHGASRAGSSGYILSEVVSEYHILREVIFNFLEENEQLSKAHRDIILDSIEQAVNDAAVQFTATYADIQQKFVSTLTHDLRSPISAAKMNVDMIVRRANDPAACIKSGQRINASLSRLDAMIKNLLDGSRLRAGESLTFEFTKCELDSLILEIVDEMSVIYGDRFTLRLDSEVIGHFGCDGLRRAIENLIGNAVKYSTPQTPIIIALNKLKQAVQIIVHNEGNPIPLKDQSILFQQYRRTKSAQESSNTGWGLGLTLVKGVVDAHHGSVRVESSEESGTSFIVELPYSSQPEPKLHENPLNA